MRILYVLPSLSIGGMERFVQRMALSMRGSGHDVVIACTRKLGELAEETVEAGVDVRLCRTEGKMGLLFPHSLKQLIRQWEPDVVHSQSGAWFPSAVASFHGKVPMMHTEHGLPLGGEPRRALVVKFLAARMTAKAVVVSSPLKAHLRMLVNEKRLSVIENGVEVGPVVNGQRDIARSMLGIPASKLALVVVARLDPIKGIDALLRVLARDSIAAHRPHLYLVGDGEERENLVRLASELSLQSVTFLGARSDVQAILPAFDGLVLPSRSEGLPLAVLEAMAQEVPVVATPVGEIPMVLAHGDAGFLAKGVADADLAEAVERFIGDSELRARLGAAGRARVIEHYSFCRMRDRYERLYRQLER